MSLRRRWVGAALLLPCALVVGACNSLLENAAGTLAPDEAGTDPPAVASNTGDAATASMTIERDAAPVKDASLPVVDAGNGCMPGQKSCDGICVSVTDPLYGCGSSNCVACLATRGTSTCVSGKCAVGVCDPGYADCNKVAADGCETDISSASCCGTCNGVCGVAAPNCAPVGPTFQCTTGCAADAPLLCGKQCSDPMTSVAHCGSCNVACPPVAHGAATCTGGGCGYTCDAHFHACAGNRCARDTDPAACGAGCVVCPKPANAAPVCLAGNCAFVCAAGTADCDGTAANGCEATLASDPKNCGACGVVCPSTCTNGKCDSPPPDAGASGDGGSGNDAGH